MSKILALMLFVINTLLWFDAEFARQVASFYSGIDSSLFTLTTSNKLIVWFISSLQISTLSFALFVVAGIFQDFAQGRWFTQRFSNQLKWVGISLLVFLLLSPVVQMLTSLALTYTNPAGERLIAFSFGVDIKGLIILFLGILLILIAKVMTKATKISDENKQII
ncbi:DUF2975 domain-containing protein [Bathymodiolus heckerae thiotrophic gill symbiont]|uniref:DUF2975 domain-containing protein n=1 Tax=Bathymodiolus heckerae thiotrophic gill symbiont TaxID=1052212 RepID=UPI0014857280|nr:DUF2975 domain-containing protein [Bathymodiolus heckerae thiotrophic gill symbiont]